VFVLTKPKSRGSSGGGKTGLGGIVLNLPGKVSDDVIVDDALVVHLFN
jgi:hypothetical protein